jgi:hypothetical protein
VPYDLIVDQVTDYIRVVSDASLINDSVVFVIVIIIVIVIAA